MAGGWTKDGAVHNQIDAHIDEALHDARRGRGKGPGRTHCEICGQPIPEARRKAVPGVRTCVACQEKAEGGR
ncbi:MAG TPA: TraR/DksA C4-type zinc finger protein [Vicinamibacterales bacterium]|jgi:phage/conjugal plasmid C-4 type zinc finger TraR family protein